MLECLQIYRRAGTLCQTRPISRHVYTPSSYVVHEGQRLSEAQEEERPDFGRRVATPDNLKRCAEDRCSSLQPPEFGILVRELQRCDDEF